MSKRAIESFEATLLDRIYGNEPAICIPAIFLSRSETLLRAGDRVLITVKKLRKGKRDALAHGEVSGAE